MLTNPILMTDSYKNSFWKMYPEKMSHAVAYFEARSPAKFADYTIFFGMQYILSILSTRITEENVREAKRFCYLHFGRTDVFNESGWRYILETHGGQLPLRIESVKEGSKIPVGHLLFRVESTDPNCAWLVSHVETLFVEIWYPITVATLSHRMKQYMIESWRRTSDAPIESLDFKLHDFGYRGVSSRESAAIGAAAHLLNFQGTDTVAGIELLEEYYGDYVGLQTFDRNAMSGFSIPAGEHSIPLSYGPNREREYIQNALREYPTGLLAMITDTYNDREFLTILGTEFREEILKRDGTIVPRTDSREPTEALELSLTLLAQHFGFTVNSKGFKVLPPQVRVIHGDGINYESIPDVLRHVESLGFSIDNIALGCGAGLLQKVNRDNFSFVYKFCNVSVGNETYGVSKHPIGDRGKRSKSGDLTLVKRAGVFLTLDKKDVQPDDEPQLVCVYNNGPQVFAEVTLGEIREEINNVRH